MDIISALFVTVSPNECARNFDGPETIQFGETLLEKATCSGQ